MTDTIQTFAKKDLPDARVLGPNSVATADFKPDRSVCALLSCSSREIV